jgi:SAM-dependent methyltransferase
MPSCKICFNKENNRNHQIKEMMIGTHIPFEYLECGFCGSLTLLDPPADMQPYYAGNYYSHLNLVSTPPWKNFLKKIRLSLFLKFNVSPPLYGEWLKLSGARKHHKIADVGCGNGQLLYELSACGYQHLEGYDPYIAQDVMVNRSLSLYKKDLFDIKREQVFDIIMMHHSFEHMDRPQEIVDKSFKLLKSGGLLLIRIPVADAQVWKNYGVNWVQLDAPRHFFIHTKKSMAIMAESAGFTMERVVFDSTAFQFWASELYRSGISLQDGKDLSRFTAQQLKAWQKKSQELNRLEKGDQACFYLRKK